MIPPASIASEVAFFIRQEAEFRGVSADSLSTMDLQMVGYGLRVASAIIDDKDYAQQLLLAANAIDELSDLEDADLTYLETLSEND